MAKVDEETRKYIAALEEELCASMEREQKLLEEDLSFFAFVAGKAKKTRLYQGLSNPDSKVGKIARAPRSVYRMIKNPEVRKEVLQKKTVSEAGGNTFARVLLEPWMVKIEHRVEIAESALRSGKRIALYYVEKPDSSTFRYRCFNTFEATQKSKKWQAVYFFKNEIDIVERLLKESSVLILGRQSGQEKTVERLTGLAKRYNVKVGLDIDDLVFDMKYLDMFLDTIGEKNNKGYWVAYFASVQAMAKKMDFFITTNEFLAKKIRWSFNKPCGVIRNSLNDEQIAASEVYVKQKEAVQKKDGFRLGYFSGSPTHAKDFAVVEKDVSRFLCEHEDATLNVVGYMRFSSEAQELVKKGRIKFLPMVDFRKLQRLMAEVDVNIAPLLINDFTNSKSELKFFEAAAVKTTTIASPTFAFKNAIENGVNGYLAESGEWYDKMEFLYNHPAENKKMAEKAYKCVLKNYHGEVLLKEVEGVYNSFAKETRR